MSDLIKVNSPLSKSTNVTKIKDVDPVWLIQSYAEKFGYNVIEFNQRDKCQLYLDQDTGYQFFFPFEWAGSGTFYNHMSNFDWYYDSDKWEFKKALQYITKEDRVIEIGCGNGSFLSKLKEHNIYFDALELNADLVNPEFRKNVYQTSIKKFAEQNPKRYSVCCFFQVLEHISDVHSFLDSAVSMIAQGGKLIISVPNNRAYLKYLDQEILNYPPHHMGRWDSKSLKSLTTLFNLKLLKIIEEPLQDVNINSYMWSLAQRKPFKRMVKYPLLKRILRAIIRIMRPFLKGHTIMAIYTKEF